MTVRSNQRIPPVLPARVRACFVVCQHPQRRRRSRRLQPELQSEIRPHRSGSCPRDPGHDARVSRRGDASQGVALRSRQSYPADPLTVAKWNHSPALFFSSIGFGYCDDSASLFRHLMAAMGYESRVWGLGGHIVAEVRIDNRWEMWDTDLQVHYFNHSGLVAGVEELAAQPDLILQPVTRLPGALPIASIPLSLASIRPRSTTP